MAETNPLKTPNTENFSRKGSARNNPREINAIKLTKPTTNPARVRSIRWLTRETLNTPANPPDNAIITYLASWPITKATITAKNKTAIMANRESSRIANNIPANAVGIRYPVPSHANKLAALAKHATTNNVEPSKTNERCWITSEWLNWNTYTAIAVNNIATIITTPSTAR